MVSVNLFNALSYPWNEQLIFIFFLYQLKLMLRFVFVFVLMLVSVIVLMLVFFCVEFFVSIGEKFCCWLGDLSKKTDVAAEDCP